MRKVVEHKGGECKEDREGEGDQEAGKAVFNTGQNKMCNM